ncbi:MAG: hypothetical protein WCS42_23790, partial [Verrucomicrobiota bacterium]
AREVSGLSPRRRDHQLNHNGRGDSAPTSLMISISSNSPAARKHDGEIITARAHDAWLSFEAGIHQNDTLRARVARALDRFGLGTSTATLDEALDYLINKELGQSAKYFNQTGKTQFNQQQITHAVLSFMTGKEQQRHMTDLAIQTDDTDHDEDNPGSIRACPHKRCGYWMKAIIGVHGLNTLLLADQIMDKQIQDFRLNEISLAPLQRASSRALITSSPRFRASPSRNFLRSRTGSQLRPERNLVATRATPFPSPVGRQGPSLPQNSSRRTSASL